MHAIFLLPKKIPVFKLNVLRVFLFFSSAFFLVLNYKFIYLSQDHLKIILIITFQIINFTIIITIITVFNYLKLTPNQNPFIINIVSLDRIFV